MNDELNDDLYMRFRELLGRRSGLSYPPHKRSDLAHSLNLVRQASHKDSLADLYEAVASDGTLWQMLVDHLTIGETYFFRNGPQFHALRHTVLPELIERRAAIKTLRLWSAGCATGEEPYSLAMLLDELLPAAAGWQPSILATDINRQFLARAREGLYGEWSFRETPEAVRARCFAPERGRWRLLPHLRRMVQFAPLNLVEESYPSIVNGTCALDLILCRNVTIYFEEATTKRIAERFYDALAPGGWLVVGHAEPQASVYHQFEVHNFPNTVVYRKSLNAPLFAFDPARGTFSYGAASQHEPPRSAPAPAKPPARANPPPAVQAAATSASPPAPPRPLPPTISLAAITAELEAGEKTKAETHLRELLHQTPEHAGARTLLGRLCADRGAWQEAQQQCEAALRYDPLALEAHYTLAQIYEHQGRLDDALAAYRRTVYLDRGFVAGQLGMANIWWQLGQLVEARRSYAAVRRQLVSSDPAAHLPGGGGATVAHVLALVTRRLQG